MTPEKRFFFLKDARKLKGAEQRDRRLEHKRSPGFLHGTALGDMRGGRQEVKRTTSSRVIQLSEQ